MVSPVHAPASLRAGTSDDRRSKSSAKTIPIETAHGEVIERPTRRPSESPSLGQQGKFQDAERRTAKIGRWIIADHVGNDVVPFGKSP